MRGATVDKFGNILTSPVEPDVRSPSSTRRMSRFREWDRADVYSSPQLLPHGKLIEFAELGHAPMIQDPAAFHKALLDGLREQ